MESDEAKKCVEIIISQKLLISLAGSCLIVIFCGITRVSDNIPLLFTTAFILPLTSVNGFINIFFQSKNNNRLLLGYYSAAFLLSGLLIYIFNATIASYQLYAGMELIFLIFLTLAIFRKTNFKLKLINLDQIRNTYKTSFSNGSSQTVVTLYSKTDLLFIQTLSSAVNVAYYGFFMRVMDPLLMIASALAISAYSFFSRHIDLADKSRVAANLRQYLMVTLTYACFMLAAITFLLPYVLHLLNSKYEIKWSLAFFFGLATAMRIMSAAQGSILFSMGKFKYTLKISIINICLLFPFYFILIPILNIKGVLISIVASELICIIIKSRTLKPVLF